MVACADQAGEAEAVASQLELYWASGRVEASEMAVMYRTNAQSRSFEEACLKRGLPFVVVGAQKFYARREVIAGCCLMLVSSASLESGLCCLVLLLYRLPWEEKGGGVLICCLGTCLRSVT